MNSTLLLANAAALAFLLGSHFFPKADIEQPVAQRMPHYLQVQKAPQWAVLSERSDASTQMVSEPEQASAPITERLVF
ncbi:hypothetical protein [Pseudomonas siliginis]|jgi:hypothetical protein|uniref:hypothetical protein n=1 Tax=Pseudomonas siliginis TaxID=2842346 RepID=UPI002092A88A|nr:hypothetical protein [Pseudomonas siliginis]UST99360.1 hypothetical protein NF680_19480 [Pseudomonas siliginis]